MMMLFPLGFVSAQKIQSSNFSITGYIKSDGTIQNSSYSTVGYIKSDGTITAVVGIGLNLNQLNFENLPNASSLQRITGLNYDNEAIAMSVRKTLQFHLTLLYESPDSLWKKYDENLFKKNELLNFVDATGNQFEGIIKRVNKDGRLEVLSSTNKRSYFDLKQIQIMI